MNENSQVSFLIGGFIFRKLNEHFQNLELNVENTHITSVRLQREVIPFFCQDNQSNILILSILGEA